MNKLISAFVFSTVLACAATFTGVVSCSMCVKNHKPMHMGTDAECVRACVKTHGSKYILVAGDKTYKLSDQQTPEKFAAQNVKITGTLFEKTGVLKVDKIEAVR
jgi:hypothetical protein